MSKVLKKIAPIAAIALPLAFPGIGTAIGAALGAGAAAAPIVGGAVLGGGLGAASGGGLKGALTGAATGGLAGGGSSLIAKSAGLTGAGAKAASGAITGASGGFASGGDLSSALTGAALGGATGYVSAGGSVPGLGNVGTGTSSNVVGGLPIPSSKPIQGTGFLGSLGSVSQGATGGANPMKLSSLLNPAGDVFGYMQGKDDLDDIQNTLMQQSQAAQAQLNPYAQAGQTALGNLQAPSMEALQNDPGYQFQLQEGNQALERSLAAQGMGQSGAAMKAAQRYGQGLASQSYNDFFNRQSSIANQGFNAAQGLGSIMQSQGDVQAAAQMQGINNRNSFLSSLLGGGTNDDGDYLQGSLGRLLGGLGGGNQGGQFYNGQRINWN